MLNSAEHANLYAHKYKIYNKIQIFQPQISLEYYFFLLINVKMPTVFAILTFMRRKIAILHFDIYKQENNHAHLS